MKHALLFISIFFSLTLFAQNGFMKVISSNDGIGRAIDNHDNGDITVATTWSDQSFNSGMQVVRYDPSGSMIWSSVLALPGGTGTALANDVTSTSDGGVIIAGEHVLGAPEDSAFVVKMDANGNIEWAKNFHYDDPGALSSKVERVIEADNGDFLLIGHSTKLNPGVEQVVIITRMSPNGNVIWTKEMDTNVPGVVAFPGAAITYTNGGLLLAGRFGEGIQGTWTAALDINGNILWTNLYHTSTGYGVVELKGTDTGYTLFEATTFDVTTGHVLKLKLDPNGALQSAEEFNVNNTLGNIRYLIEPDSTVILLGDFETSPGNKDVVMIKLDINDQPVWAKTYGSGGIETAVGITWSISGGYMVLATAEKDSILNVNEPFLKQPWLIKTDGQGISGGCEQTLPNVTVSTTTITSSTISPTPVDRVGWANASFVQTSPYAEILVCGTQVGVAEHSAVEFNVYPNPTNGMLRLVCNERILASEVYALTGERLHGFGPETVLDIGGLEPGCYVLSVNTASGTMISRALFKE